MAINKLWELLLQALNIRMKSWFGVGLVRAGGEFEIARKHIISKCEITVVVDGGANSGQWAKQLRKYVPDAKIISFEPLRVPFAKLLNNSQNDPKWSVHNQGLGSKEQIVTMHVSSNDGMSSSSKKPTNHIVQFQDVKFEKTEDAKFLRLDSKDELIEHQIYLKLDVQGSEWEAIEGSSQLIKNIAAIEVETSLIPMYEGELNHYELIPKIIELGYQPYAVSPPYRDPNGRCTYMDVLLVRKELI